MSNSNKKNHSTNNQRPTHNTKQAPQKTPSPVETKPAPTPAGAGKAAPTTPEGNVMDNLKTALDNGSITKEEFTKFVTDLGFSTAPKAPAATPGNYKDDIISMMKQYEVAFPVRAISTPEGTVKMQRRLWGIVLTAVSQSDYKLFKEGYRAIIQRFKTEENYTVQYLYRGLANPTDPTPVIESYTIKLYNLMSTTARKGTRGILGTIDLDKITSDMPAAARNNLIEFYANA